MYIRKTKDVYVLMSNYGYGWEEEVEEDTLKEGKERLKEYRENCKNASYRLVKKRIKL